MAKQTFTVGQILTSAQMTSLQQTAMLGGAASAKTASYTLVAADAGTAISMSNASATTITVNTALFAAGDTVQITNLGAGVCTITAGTATVNTSASLALAQYESGTLDFTSTSAAIFIKGAGASAASGGMTQIATGNLSGSNSVTISGISGSYKNLILFMKDWYSATATHYGSIRINNNSTGSNHTWTLNTTRVTANVNNTGANEFHLNDGADGFSGAAADNFAYMVFYDYANTTTKKVMEWGFIYTQNDGSIPLQSGGAAYKNATPAAITDISMIVQGGSNWAGGSYELYGVN